MNTKKSDGFTLIELLVVISIIAVLMSIMAPALTKAREQAKKTICGSRQKQWVIGAMAYAVDNNSKVVGFSDRPYRVNKETALLWPNLLAPYMSDNSNIGKVFYDSSIWLTEARMCPSAQKRPAEQVSTWTGEYDTWFGVHFGLGAKDVRGGSAVSAPFYYPEDAEGKTLKLSQLSDHSNVMFLTDTNVSYVYSPTYSNYMFDFHYDDGSDTKIRNSSRRLLIEHPDRPYNECKPRSHNEGTNVALFDGHVEYVKFSDMWEVTPKGMPVHPFWYMNKAAKSKAQEIYGSPYSPTYKPNPSRK